MNESWEIRVSRQDLAVSEIGAGVDHDVALDEEQVLFAIDSFAMTANNVTYAVMGDAMKYWNFFPTVDGWGIVPVWGFADVVGSGSSRRGGRRSVLRLLADGYEISSL